MAPRGLSSAMGMLLVARLITRFDPRYLIGTGLVLSATTTLLMSHYHLGISPGSLIWPGLLQGLGTGMIFVPLTTLASQALPRQSVDQAAGIFDLARTIGSSAGISIAATALTRSTQVHWSQHQPIQPDADRRELFFLPPYAPQISPDELAWAHLKHRLGRAPTQTKTELKQRAIAILRCLQELPHFVAGFFHAPSCAYAAR